MPIENIRNIAIIAHVDHGKTTLVDKMLYQSGMFRSAELDKLAGGIYNLIMDSDPIERERGITILSKNCAIRYRDTTGAEYKINIIDTPGHADFGGEVERVLKMADGVLLLVDSFEGPMPQTRFVLDKALANGLVPIVVINKIDRPDARSDEVVNEVFDLFVELDANSRALDFPCIFASAREGRATTEHDADGTDLRPIFDAIVRHVPPPSAVIDAPPQLLVTTLDYSEYVGRICIGRMFAGSLKSGQQVSVIDRNSKATRQKIVKLYQFEGLSRKETESVSAGDICAIVGLDPVGIGDTIASPDDPRPLPAIRIEEPTLHMTFRVNDGPFAGREGQYVTSRQLAGRLERELQVNVALRVGAGETPQEFNVSGRGILHLGILLENMRREGYELCVGKPEVIYREVDGKRHEPVERLAIECPAECKSAVMSLIGDRRAEIAKMSTRNDAGSYVHMEFMIPARGLIGLQSRMLTATQGRAVMHHTFDSYQPFRGPIPPQRNVGVIVATEPGRVTAYALDALFDRGIFFVQPGDEVYEGQVVGEHCMRNDIGANVVRQRQKTNIRSSTKDDAAKIRPMRVITLEHAIEYIQEDEYVEVTPKTIRMRKKLLKELDRRRASRK